MTVPLRRPLLIVLLVLWNAASGSAQGVGLTLDSLRVGDRVRVVRQDFLPAIEGRGTLQFVSADSLLVRFPFRSNGKEPEMWTIRRAAIASIDVSRRQEVSAKRTMGGALLGLPLGLVGSWGACFLVYQISSSGCTSTSFGIVVLLGTVAGVTLGARAGAKPVDRWDAVRVTSSGSQR